MQESWIEVLTIMQRYGNKAEAYQSKFIRMYDPAGIFFCNLNENMYIESEFYVLGYNWICLSGSNEDPMHIITTSVRIKLLSLDINGKL